MTSVSPPDRRAAVTSLLSWWEAAGVDVVAPAAPAASPVRAQSPAAPPQRSAGRAPERPAARPAPNAPGAQTALEDDAAAIAARCTSLDALAAALATFDHPLRAAARNTVFARGDRDADVMLIGEAPGREEDLEGLPFVGRSGQLLDRMFAEIGLAAEKGLYITNVVNWRPRNNKTPDEADIALCRPFIERHIVLKRPKILVLAGAVAAQTMLSTAQGITRMRGKWMSFKAKAAGSAAEPIPALPILHPAFILRRPIAKRDVWRDLLTLEERLKAL